jgi:hypothetical protein
MNTNNVINKLVLGDPRPRLVLHRVLLTISFPTTLDVMSNLANIVLMNIWQRVQTSEYKLLATLGKISKNIDTLKKN